MPPRDAAPLTEYPHDKNHKILANVSFSVGISSNDVVTLLVDGNGIL